jgi:hypothetical protein
MRSSAGSEAQVLPEAWRGIEQYANNRIEADHAPAEETVAAHARSEDRCQRQIRHRRAYLSFRTSVAATMDSPTTLHRSYMSRLPSMNSLKQPEPQAGQASHGDCDQTTQQSRRGSSDGLHVLSIVYETLRWR